MRIVSYFTPGEIYSQHETELRATLHEFAPLAFYRTIPIMNQGSWEANCAMKPEAIINQWDKMEEGDRLLYLDVDARLRGPIDELANHGRWPDESPAFDVGLHITRTRAKGPVVLSGTLLFLKTAGAAELLSRWNAKCKEAPGTWDQIHLALAISEMQNIRVWDFGPEYVFIHDRFKKRYPGKQPIIEHLQASRVARRA